MSAVELLPTVTGKVDGVVGVNPTRLQCAECGAIETPGLLILMRTKFYGLRKGDRRRLCESCAATAGYGVHE